MGDKLKFKITKKMLLIFGILLLGLFVVMFLFKQKKEHADFKSTCGRSGNYLIVEQCLAKSNKWDEFETCLKENGADKKIISDFPPLEFAMMVGTINCEDIKTVVDEIIPPPKDSAQPETPSATPTN